MELLDRGVLTPASIVLDDGNRGHPTWGSCGTWPSAPAPPASAPAPLTSRLHEGRGPALDGPGSSGRGRGSRSPSARGLEWVSSTSDARLAPSRPGGAIRRAEAFVGGVLVLLVYRGELQGRALGAKVESFDEQGNPLIDEVLAGAGADRADAVDAGLLLARRDGCGTGPSDSRPTRGSGATATGSRSCEGGDDLRRAGPTINRQGAAHGHQRDLPRGAGRAEVVDALVVEHPGEGSRGWMPLFVVPPKAPSWNDELGKRSRRTSARSCSPRHVPNEVFASPKRHVPSGKACRSGQADPDGRARRPRRQPRSSANPSSSTSWSSWPT